MIGAIIGDIAGSAYEFKNTRNFNFDMFGPDADYTDDTILTVAVADAIINGDDFSTALRRWGNKYPNPKGAYGATFSRWLANPHAGPYNSFGNGAAMRVSPCGYAETLRSARRLAIESARVSHNHKEGLLGACSVAEMIWQCRHSLGVEDCLQGIKKIRVENYGNAVIPKPGEWNETCQGCVPLAAKIIDQSIGFEDAIRLAVSYGGDSDTLGAIVGGIAEAIWGVPDSLREKALGYLPDDMKEIITKFENKYGK